MEEPQTLRALAVLRLLVGTVVLGAADVWRAPLLVEPVVAAHSLRALVLVAATLTVVGLWTRAATIALAVGLAALFGLLQQQGTPIHVHHVVWLAVLLAASPAGAAWSIDARRAPPKAAPATEADAALRWCCVVLGLVYFFPGAHKLADRGSPFFDADALARLARLKALEAGHDVTLGIDDHPRLLLAGAAAVVAAELLVIVAALVRPRVGVALVVVIHVAIVVALDMPYTVLAVFALVFALPSSRGLAFLRQRRLAVVGGALVLGIGWAGIRGDMQGYPFACYPTFSTPVPGDVRVLFVDAVEPTGAVRRLPHAVVVPDDMRTPVTFAARRVTTAADAERFVRWRQADARFASAVDGARALRVTVVRRDLGSPRAPDAVVLVADVRL